MSVKSKHSATKKDKNGKREKKKNLEESNEEIESSEEELDLTKECHPIGFYINDRAEMINQMFSVIKGNKLKAMLPPILKDCDTDQLKLQCLDQLLGMSEKRIMCILEGGTLESSSESEVIESDDYETDEKIETTSSSSSESSNESYENGYCDSNIKKHKRRKNSLSNEEHGGKIVKTNEETPAPEQGKTLLEILELEMRARAIRALLKQSGNEKEAEQENSEIKIDGENGNGVKDCFSEVVDLTECEDEEKCISIKKDKLEENNVSKKMRLEKKEGNSKHEKFDGIKQDESLNELETEMEVKNKLFKNKIYRVRQQKVENNERISEEPETEKVSNNILIKIEPAEPQEPEEILVEDPEEGEISTSEDDFPVEIKQEVIVEEKQTLEEPLDMKYSTGGEDKEQTTDDNKGSMMSNCNTEAIMKTRKENVLQPEPFVEENAGSIAESQLLQESIAPNQTNEIEKTSHNISIAEENKKSEKDLVVEETSWRDRWLQKDGVQKLVKSSKIYAKVKKRIAEKSLKAKEEAPPLKAKSTSEVQNDSKIEVIEGSIKEYEKLFGKVKEQKQTIF